MLSAAWVACPASGFPPDDAKHLIRQKQTEKLTMILGHSGRHVFEGGEVFCRQGNWVVMLVRTGEAGRAVGTWMRCSGTTRTKRAARRDIQIKLGRSSRPRRGQRQTVALICSLELAIVGEGHRLSGNAGTIMARRACKPNQGNQHRLTPHQNRLLHVSRLPDPISRAFSPRCTGVSRHKGAIIAIVE